MERFPANEKLLVRYSNGKFHHGKIIAQKTAATPIPQVIRDRLTQTRSSLSLMTWGIGVAAIFWTIILPWWNFPFEYLTKSFSLSGNLSNYNAPGWVLILWIIIVGTVIPYLLTVTGIRELSAGTSSVIGMIEPIFAGVIAWILLNEALSGIQLIGCVVVLFGIYLADKARATVGK